MSRNWIIAGVAAVCLGVGIALVRGEWGPVLTIHNWVGGVEPALLSRGSLA
jgi:hypothetical protein